ncbi:hydantoinase B/oxoprolinase family protein [Mycolicibacterium sp. CH28]|uniref:hydantoinase B/oxoprolinase family protein n=1 Tax=Mycolicibacterium sp. CH28 TaxID=2512237 RepID=UPI001081D13F|nr:hydantoinase B/oxoprolinase family protein [Mycolicibacterium sp. CH28]TGD89111.1 hydantoinase B/oxoprolinase family protein [Mycolicibacterium sp. CH28]
MSGRDLQINNRLKPEPWTDRERTAVGALNDHDLSIFAHKLESTAVECQELLLRLGASTGARWGDSGFAFYTAQGDIAVCSTGIYFHAFLQQIPIKYTMAHWLDDPSVGVRPGDAFFNNDPLYGGVHAADMTVFMPVFDDDELIGWVGAVIHTGECGAQDPGGVTLRSRSRYEEGILVPPVKICSAGVIREDVVNLLANGVRDPRMLVMDIKARLAACRRGQERLLDESRRRGKDFVIGGLRQLIQMATDAARNRVRSLPDGVVRQNAFLDTVGTGDALLKMGLQVTKTGDRLHLDLTDSSPELVAHSSNTFSHTLVGMSATYLCNYLFPDLPVNSGLAEVLDWEFRPGTFISPSADAAVSMCPNPMAVFNLAFSLALAKLVYSHAAQRAVAPWFSGFNMPIYGGVNQWGEPVSDLFSELNAGGSGARPNQDGVNVAGAFFASLSDSGEVEQNELGIPVLYAFRNRFLADSCGHGRYRGGAGLDAAYMVHHVPFLMFGSLGFGSRFPCSLGLFGGYASPSLPSVSITDSDLLEKLANGDASVPATSTELLDGHALAGEYRYRSINTPVEPAAAGDIYLVPTGGGTGYGDVLEREPEAVAVDVRDGIVTAWAARTVYGVVIDEATGSADEVATVEARRSVRAERLKRGKPLEEFEREWSRLKPPDEVLVAYGSWPHPSEGPVPTGVIR